MILEIRDCWDNARTLHAAYFDRVVVASRDALSSSLPQDVVDFLVHKHSRIRDGGEAEFRIIQAEFDQILNGLGRPEQIRVNEVISKIFDYGAFSRNCKKRWCAYKLCALASMRTCPYCNLSYEVTIVKNSRGRIRPALDHFFDKASHPLFGISLGNLVPSCHHCNSTFKGAKNFFADLHLNPLVSGEVIRILLDVDPIDARIDLRKIDRSNVRLEFDVSDVRQLNSVRTFFIAERYQAIIDEVRAIVRNMVSFSAQGIADPVKMGWVQRDVTTQNYRDKILGKMILDLSSTYL